ncbi:MAG: MFS transporter [Anaerolineae bacterium]|nr:MFS transporter [Anaerolineae bacterium]
MTEKRALLVQPARVLFPLGLGTALSLMGDATLYTVLPTHTADAGITLASVGVMLGVNRAVRLFLNGPAGLAYDRWPRRRLFIPALFIGALSTALYAVVRGFWPLLIARMLWGLAWSGIWIGGATMILDVTVAQDRGRWTGFYQTWFFLGAALGSLLGGALTDAVGYASTMWIGAALTTLGAVVALALLPETRKQTAAGAHSAAHPRHSPEEATRPRLRANADLWSAVTLQGINRFVISGVLTATLGLLVQARLQDTGIRLGVATLTGILMAGQTLFSMLAAPFSGVLSDRLGSRWGVVAMGLAAGALGMGLLAWGVWVGILAGALLVAASKGALQSMATTVTGDVVGPAQRGRAIGVLHTAGDLGSAIGPSVAYALLPWLDLHGIYWLCAGIFALSFGLALWMQSRKPSMVPVEV